MKGGDSNGLLKIHIKPKGWTPHRIAVQRIHVDIHSIADFTDRRKRSIKGAGNMPVKAAPAEGNTDQ